MLEYLRTIDESLLLFLNGEHSAFFDEFFWLVTGKFAWIPMICVLLYCSFRKGWKSGVLMILAIALTIALCDQISGVIKDIVCRYRPTQDPMLRDLVHVVNDYRGGRFGFVSSHAANSFGVAAFLAMVFGRRSFTWAIMAWAVILSYSRIYLGVHFPGDILCGGILGVILGIMVYYIYKNVTKTKTFSKLSPYDRADAAMLTWTTIGNMLLVFVVALIIFVLK